ARAQARRRRVRRHRGEKGRAVCVVGQREASGRLRPPPAGRYHPARFGVDSGEDLMLGTRKRRGANRSPGLFADDGRRLVLHVGCGPPYEDNLHDRFRTAEWRELRLDIDPRVRPDIVDDITDMRTVPPESVDAVWSSHNVEHVYAYLVPRMFAEFLRVLRAGGELL